MSKFYFAWVGGASYPAFELQTTADIWGGSLQTQGTVWGGEFSTTGNLAVGDNRVLNVADTLPLVAGQQYLIQGPGIPQNFDGTPSTTFTFNGSDTFNLSHNAVGVGGGSMAGANLRITNLSARTIVTGLVRTDGLKVGTVYAVSGGGIAPGTTATWDGKTSLILSQPATSTIWRASLTLSNPDGRNQVLLGATEGLIEGQVYQFFGPGVPSGNFFTWDGSNVATLTVAATETRTAAFVLIAKGRSEDDGGPFDPSQHAVFDESVLAIDLVHEEGQIPVLTIEIKNPYTGFLSPGRKQWAWLSWDDGSGTIMPLFHGRLVGVPQRLANETVQLQLIAKATNFEAQKASLAESLRVLPYFDPVWLQQSLYDPDTVLETYSSHWHVDRTSLEVTTSDILEGEDGTLTLSEDQHWYDSLDVSYGQAPEQAVAVNAVLTFTQAGEGEIDLTPNLVQAFLDAGGAPFTGGDTRYGIVGSFTGSGLLASWPQPGSSIGAGWSMAADSVAVRAAWLPTGVYTVSWVDRPDGANNATIFQSPQQGPGALAGVNSTSWNASFPFFSIATTFTVRCEASRARSESINFVLSADTQAVLTDPGIGEVITVASQVIDKPVDLGGLLPIGDVRRNAYLPTERGQQSLQYLMLLARARLRARARTVTVRFRTSWALAIGLSCRWAVQLFDRRLPGGECIGKVVGLRFSFRDGEMLADVTLGSAIGYGNTLATPVNDNDSWADDWADGWTLSYSALSVVDGELQYAPPQGVVDDDGVDLFNMTPNSVLLSPIEVVNGPLRQKEAIAAVINGTLGPTSTGSFNNLGGSNTAIPTPITALGQVATTVTVDLVPVTGGNFRTDFLVVPSKLMIPKMIDLEAA